MANLLAEKWRIQRGYKGKGGVVILFNGEVQGWSNKLRDPHTWVPGCIAIDEQGNQWQSVGGDEYNGAKEWQKLSINTDN